MPIFADDILAAAGGEDIDSVVIGAYGWTNIGEDEAVGPEHRQVPAYWLGKVIEWDVAEPVLRYEYDDGYGSASCHAIWAWTPNRVIFVSTYDGSTRLGWVPRNPQEGDPDMPGGG